MAGTRRRDRYHHGDLASALVEGGVALLSEAGPAGFSVAELARRIGVSTAAPYRHFADRDRLLAAVVARLAARLADGLRRATAAAGPDPGDRLCAAAGAYVEFVTAHRVGFDVLYSPALRAARDEDLAAAGRDVMGLMLAPALELRPGPDAALRLVEQVVALAHGYATLDAGGFLTTDRVTDDTTATRAATATAALVSRDHR